MKTWECKYCGRVMRENNIAEAHAVKAGYPCPSCGHSEGYRKIKEDKNRSGSVFIDDVNDDTKIPGLDEWFKLDSDGSKEVEWTPPTPEELAEHAAGFIGYCMPEKDEGEEKEKISSQSFKEMFLNASPDTAMGESSYKRISEGYSIDKMTYKGIPLEAMYQELMELREYEQVQDSDPINKETIFNLLKEVKILRAENENLKGTNNGKANEETPD